VPEGAGPLPRSRLRSATARPSQARHRRHTNYGMYGLQYGAPQAPFIATSSNAQPIGCSGSPRRRKRGSQIGKRSIQVTVDIDGHLVPGGNRAAVDRLDDAQPDATPAQPDARIVDTQNALSRLNQW
jgi:hypothetical protein